MLCSLTLDWQLALCSLTVETCILLYSFFHEPSLTFLKKQREIYFHSCIYVSVSVWMYSMCLWVSMGVRAVVRSPRDRVTVIASHLVRCWEGNLSLFGRAVHCTEPLTSPPLQPWVTFGKLKNWKKMITSSWRSKTYSFDSLSLSYGKTLKCKSLISPQFVMKLYPSAL